MMVNVIGLGKALRMDFEEVLVRAEVRYQITHRTWRLLSADNKLIQAQRFAHNDLYRHWGS